MFECFKNTVLKELCYSYVQFLYKGITLISNLFPDSENSMEIGNEINELMDQGCKADVNSITHIFGISMLDIRKMFSLDKQHE